MTNTPELAVKVARIHSQLRAAYGEPERWAVDDPVGELVAVVISQHTSDVNTDRAFKNLLARFGNWEAVRDAPVGEIAVAIKSAGLANVKAPRIKDILQTISARHGRLSIDYMASLPLEQAKAELRALPGVGPKTAACTLLFALHRPAFPVDVHIHRVSRRLGLIGDRVGADEAHGILEPLLPPDPDEVFSFHVLMIWHGRRTCRAQRPNCPGCPLLLECAYGRRVVGLTE
jgi:endonuclease-3